MISAFLVAVWIISLPSTRACRDDVLLVVENGDYGAVASAYLGRRSSRPLVQLELLLQLSPECGRVHCQNPLVLEETTGRPALLFVPLAETLAIVEVKRNEDMGIVAFGQVKFLHPSEVHCHPSTVFLVDNNVFAACTDQTSNSVYILEVILDRNHLNKTRYTYSNDLHLSEGNLSNRTNFLQVDYMDYHFILFGIGRALYSLRPYIFSATRMEDIPEARCDSLQWLAMNEGTRFWAYCGNSVVNYDVGIGDWREAFTLEEKGISIPCQQAGIDVCVFPSFINVTRQGGTFSIIRKEGRNFVSGVCSGSGDRSSLMYVDEIAGIIKLDLSSSKSTFLFDGNCTDSCIPPVVIADKYLVVRSVSEGVVLVLDAHNVSQTLMEVKKVHAPVVALVTLRCDPEATSASMEKGLQEKGLQKSGRSVVNVERTVGFVVLGVAVLVLTAASAALAVLWHRKGRLQTTSRPENERSFSIIRDDGVFPSATKYNYISQVSSQPLTKSEERVAVPDHHFFQELEGQPAAISSLDPDPVSLESSQGYPEDAQLMLDSAEVIATTMM